MGKYLNHFKYIHLSKGKCNILNPIPVKELWLKKALKFTIYADILSCTQSVWKMDMQKMLSRNILTAM